MKLESEEMKGDGSNSGDSTSDNKNIHWQEEAEDEASACAAALCLMREVASSGCQSDSFLVCDTGRIVESYKKWNEAFPNIKQAFGELDFLLL